MFLNISHWCQYLERPEKTFTFLNDHLQYLIILNGGLIIDKS